MTNLQKSLLLFRSAAPLALLVGSFLSASAQTSSPESGTIGVQYTENYLDYQRPNPLTGTTVNTEYIGVDASFYPIPSPSYWSSPPTFSQIEAFEYGTKVTATQNGTAVNLPHVNSPAVPYQFFADIPYNPSLLGSWNLQVAHAGYSTANFLTNNLSGVPLLPFVQNVSVNNLGTAPVINWILSPVSAPNGMTLTTDLFVFNSSESLIDLLILPSTVTSFDFSTLTTSPYNVITFPTPLSLNSNFTVQIADSLVGTANGDQYSISRSFVQFTPSTEGSQFNGQIYLPDVVTAGGAPTYDFDMTVAVGATYNIDPSLARGFIYETGAGDPNFASVELPNIGGLNDYSLYLWDNGKWVFDTFLAPDTIFDFASGGVSEFEILGINPGVDASNGNAFVTQVSFVGDGTFNGSMTAVIPEPSTWAMALIGFTGLGFAGYRASRRNAVVAA